MGTNKNNLVDMKLWSIVQAPNLRSAFAYLIYLCTLTVHLVWAGARIALRVREEFL